MTKDFDEEAGITGGGIEAVDQDSDDDKNVAKNKKYASRSLPSVNMSSCFDTRGKKRAWCGFFVVVLIVVIGILVASLKKLNSTEVRY